MAGKLNKGSIFLHVNEKNYLFFFKNIFNLLKSLINIHILVILNNFF